MAGLVVSCAKLGIAEAGSVTTAQDRAPTRDYEGSRAKKAKVVEEA